jgi:hypothetical protein
MSTKKPKSKPGPAGRDTTSILLRIDPSLADWLSDAADRTGKSRTKLIEGWLESLRTVVAESEEAREAGLSPFAAMELLGGSLLGQLVRSGFETEFIEEAWQELSGRQNALVKEAIQSQKERKK